LTADEPAPTHVKTLTALGQALRTADGGIVSSSSITYFKRMGMPAEKTPLGYEVEPSRQWLADRADANRDTRSGQTKVSYQGKILRDELLKVNLEEKKFRLELMKSDYLKVAEVKRREVERLTTLKHGILNLPRSMSAQLVNLSSRREIENIMGRACRKLLVNWVQMGRVDVKDDELEV
jgi:hypothetical protein